MISVECFILGLFVLQTNFFLIELSESIICVDGFLKVQTYSNLDTANVLKTKILPARDSPLGS